MLAWFLGCLASSTVLYFIILNSIRPFDRKLFYSLYLASLLVLVLCFSVWLYDWPPDYSIYHEAPSHPLRRFPLVYYFLLILGVFPHSKMKKIGILYSGMVILMVVLGMGLNIRNWIDSSFFHHKQGSNPFSIILQIIADIHMFISFLFGSLYLMKPHLAKLTERILANQNAKEMADFAWWEYMHVIPVSALTIVMWLATVIYFIPVMCSNSIMWCKPYGTVGHILGILYNALPFTGAVVIVRGGFISGPNLFLLTIIWLVCKLHTLEIKDFKKMCTDLVKAKQPDINLLLINKYKELNNSIHESCKELNLFLGTQMIMSAILLTAFLWGFLFDSMIGSKSRNGELIASFVSLSVIVGVTTYTLFHASHITNTCEGIIPFVNGLQTTNEMEPLLKHMKRSVIGMRVLFWRVTNENVSKITATFITIIFFLVGKSALLSHIN